MIPQNIRNQYFEVGAMLSCNRARVDATIGIKNLREKLKQESTFLSDWRIEYIGVCALLRASVHLISVDAKACHNKDICYELKNEWQLIRENADQHDIYWYFINKERNSILKDYHWSSYVEYLDENKLPLTGNSTLLGSLILNVKSSDLKIRGGPFDGQKTIEVLDDAADWLEKRITTAVGRAGFNLKERIHFQSWSRMPVKEKTNSLFSLAEPTAPPKKNDA